MRKAQWQGKAALEKMLLRVKPIAFLLISLISFFPNLTLSSDDDSCVYVVYVRTGSIWKGGTDSIISLRLFDSNGWGIEIPNLEAWGGLMGPGHNYYERGNLDIFSGRGPCLDAPVCAMNLTSDGSGSHHGWYCNYVEVTTTGPHIPCHQQLFTVEQWLALDTSPYVLTAVRDSCESGAVMGAHVRSVSSFAANGRDRRVSSMDRIEAA